MYYKISFNEKKIRNVTSRSKLQYEQIGSILGIDKEHFDEKDNWYYIDGLMQYFKQREDSRILGELLSCEILRMHGFIPATYEIISLDGKIGLISQNIHKEGFRYESVATLHKIFPGFLSKYYSDSRKVTLKKIFEFIDNNVPNSIEIKYQIIRKYLIDWFTNQLDYNIRNMTFEIDNNNNLNLSRIIDSESSFCATKNGINTDLSKIWIPAIPAEDETFRIGPYKIDEYDANIMWLVVEYNDIVMPLLKEFTDTNYDNIIRRYKESEHSDAITIEDKGLDFLKSYVEEKQQESENFKKI